MPGVGAIRSTTKSAVRRTNKCATRADEDALGLRHHMSAVPRAVIRSRRGPSIVGATPADGCSAVTTNAQIRKGETT